MEEKTYHYNAIGEVPWDIQKYYHQRRGIFSRYDDGIWMTEDAWYGVTPEPVAKKISTQLINSSSPSKTIMIDCFAGVGGNTIHFALSGRWDRVYGIEKDAEVLACARHNAEIYGVADQIEWIEGDCFDVLKDVVGRDGGDGTRVVIFGSPPWGGPGYRIDSVFDLSKMQPYNLNDLLDLFLSLTDDVILYLPRTSDLRQIAARAPQGGEDEKMTVMHYCMDGASKALCAYFGNFKF